MALNATIRATLGIDSSTDDQAGASVALESLSSALDGLTVASTAYTESAEDVIKQLESATKKSRNVDSNITNFLSETYRTEAHARSLQGEIDEGFRGGTNVDVPTFSEHFNEMMSQVEETDLRDMVDADVSGGTDEYGLEIADPIETLSEVEHFTADGRNVGIFSSAERDGVFSQEAMDAFLEQFGRFKMLRSDETDAFKQVFEDALLDLDIAGALESFFDGDLEMAFTLTPSELENVLEAEGISIDNEDGIYRAMIEAINEDKRRNLAVMKQAQNRKFKQEGVYANRKYNEYGEEKYVRPAGAQGSTSYGLRGGLDDEEIENIKGKPVPWRIAYNEEEDEDEIQQQYLAEVTDKLGLYREMQREYPDIDMFDSDIDPRSPSPDFPRHMSEEIIGEGFFEQHTDLLETDVFREATTDIQEAVLTRTLPEIVDHFDSIRDESQAYELWNALYTEAIEEKITNKIKEQINENVPDPRDYEKTFERHLYSAPLTDIPKITRDAQGRFVNRLQTLDSTDFIESARRVGMPNALDVVSASPDDFTNVVDPASDVYDQYQLVQQTDEIIQEQLELLDNADEDNLDLIDRIFDERSSLRTVADAYQLSGFSHASRIDEAFTFLRRPERIRALDENLGLENIEDVARLRPEEMFRAFENAVDELDTENIDGDIKEPSRESVLRQLIALRSRVLDDPDFENLRNDAYVDYLNTAVRNDITPDNVDSTALDRSAPFMQPMSLQTPGGPGGRTSKSRKDTLLSLGMVLDVQEETLIALQELSKQRMGLNDTDAANNVANLLLSMGNVFDSFSEFDDVISEAESFDEFVEIFEEHTKTIRGLESTEQWLENTEAGQQLQKQLGFRARQRENIVTDAANSLKELRDQLYEQLHVDVPETAKYQSDVYDREFTTLQAEILANAITELDPAAINQSREDQANIPITQAGIVSRIQRRMLSASPGSQRHKELLDLLTRMRWGFLKFQTVFQAPTTARAFEQEFSRMLPEELRGLGIASEVTDILGDQGKTLQQVLGEYTESETSNMALLALAKLDLVDDDRLNDIDFDSPDASEYYLDTNDLNIGTKSDSPIADISDAMQDAFESQAYLMAREANADELIQTTQFDDRYSLTSLYPGKHRNTRTYKQNLQDVMGSLRSTRDESIVMLGSDTSTTVPMIGPVINRQEYNTQQRTGLSGQALRVIMQLTQSNELVSERLDYTGSTVQSMSKKLTAFTRSVEELNPALKTGSTSLGPISIKMEQGVGFLLRLTAALAPLGAMLAGLGAGLGVAAVGLGSFLAVGAADFILHMEDDMAGVKNRQEAMSELLKQFKDAAWYALRPIRASTIGGKSPWEMFNNLMYGSMSLLHRFSEGVARLAELDVVEEETKTLARLIRGSGDGKSFVDYMETVTKNMLPIIVDIFKFIARHFGPTASESSSLAVELVTELSTALQNATSAFSLITDYGTGFYYVIFSAIRALTKTLDALASVISVIPGVSTNSDELAIAVGKVIGTIYVASSLISALESIYKVLAFVYNIQKGVSVTLTAANLTFSQLLLVISASILGIFGALYLIKESLDSLSEGDWIDAMLEFVAGALVLYTSLAHLYSSLASLQGVAQAQAVSSGYIQNQTAVALGHSSASAKLPWYKRYINKFRLLIGKWATSFANAMRYAGKGVLNTLGVIKKSLFIGVRTIQNSTIVMNAYATANKRVSRISLTRAVVMTAGILAAVVLAGALVKTVAGSQSKDKQSTTSTSSSRSRSNNDDSREKKVPYTIKKKKLSVTASNLNTDNSKKNKKQQGADEVRLRQQDDVTEDEFVDWVAKNATEQL